MGVRVEEHFLQEHQNRLDLLLCALMNLQDAASPCTASSSRRKDDERALQAERAACEYNLELYLLNAVPKLNLMQKSMLKFYFEVLE